MENKILYLAYGSNMSEEQMNERCNDHQLVGPVFLKDYCLNFRASSTGYYATLDEKKDHQVAGILWLISKEDESILDGYEGVESACYYKKTVSVDWKNEMVDALVYLIPESREQGQPPQWYVQRIQTAYERFDLDTTELISLANQLD